MNDLNFSILFILMYQKALILVFSFLLRALIILYYFINYHYKKKNLINYSITLFFNIIILKSQNENVNFGFILILFYAKFAILPYFK
jgi:hypothetical protein